jgi:hypothetical protein
MELALEAADGWQISNDRAAVPISANVVALAEESDPFLYGSPLVRRVGPPTGHYNCHGLTFAARRTHVPDPDVDVDVTAIVDAVLTRDGYYQVQHPEVGDVVVYRTGQKAIDHTGIVCWIDQPVYAVYVWSMWGNLGEFRHPESLSPYGDCSLEYWRLRR